VWADGAVQAGVYKVADDVKNEYVSLYRFSRCGYAGGGRKEGAHVQYLGKKRGVGCVLALPYPYNGRAA